MEASCSPPHSRFLNSVLGCTNQSCPSQTFLVHLDTEAGVIAAIVLVKTRRGVHATVRPSSYIKRIILHARAHLFDSVRAASHFTAFKYRLSRCNFLFVCYVSLEEPAVSFGEAAPIPCAAEALTTLPTWSDSLSMYVLRGRWHWAEQKKVSHSSNY